MCVFPPQANAEREAESERNDEEGSGDDEGDDTFAGAEQEDEEEEEEDVVTEGPLKQLRVLPPVHPSPVPVLLDLPTEPVSVEAASIKGGSTGLVAGTRVQAKPVAYQEEHYHWAEVKSPLDGGRVQVQFEREAEGAGGKDAAGHEAAGGYIPVQPLCSAYPGAQPAHAGAADGLQAAAICRPRQRVDAAASERASQLLLVELPRR